MLCVALWVGCLVVAGRHIGDCNPKNGDHYGKYGGTASNGGASGATIINELIASGNLRDIVVIMEGANGMNDDMTEQNNVEVEVDCFGDGVVKIG